MLLFGAIFLFGVLVPEKAQSSSFQNKKLPSPATTAGN